MDFWGVFRVDEMSICGNLARWFVVVSALLIYLFVGFFVVSPRSAVLNSRRWSIRPAADFRGRIPVPRIAQIDRTVLGPRR